LAFLLGLPMEFCISRKKLLAVEKAVEKPG
jgi:hypothetical protein